MFSFTCPKPPVAGNAFVRFYDATPTQRTVAAAQLVSALEEEIRRLSRLVAEELLMKRAWASECVNISEDMCCVLRVCQWLRIRYKLGRYAVAKPPVARLAAKWERERDEYTRHHVTNESAVFGSQPRTDDGGVDDSEA
ncbi:MAG: hypothetical protein K8U57_03540 [Planctomycetes bacterium]|nr:hypothetical protein [Planctomycetota bacterium]